MIPHWIEVATLTVVLCASGYLFWRRARVIYDLIRRSKDDPELTVHPVWPRVRKFVWEVMLQGLVIRERPLPGIAHALVFWGFCGFALVTVNHLASGFGLPLFTREGAFGRIYFMVAAVFAVAVAIGITGLFIRRFIVRPRWLEPLSIESGFIAFLIFALMATYLAGFLWVGESGLAGHAVWWAHTLALLIFLPLIPHTKHLHLMLSPATVFLKRQSFSRIPPLQGDEDFGLDAGKDVTKLVALQVYTCVECGRCTEHCPAYNTGKILNPKEIVLGARHYLNEFGPRSEEPLLGKHIPMEAAFQCTTCGSCEYQCPVGIQHLPIIIGLRRGATNTGKWEDEYGTKLFLKLERNGNPMGFAHTEREKFIQKNALPFYDGTQEYCLWLGCMGSYDPQGREIVLALVRVLGHLGITFGVLRKEKCTGDAARRLGNDLLFAELAEANLGEIKKSGAKKLLSICPHCVRTIGTDWKEIGADIQIEHHSELLARFSSKLPVHTNGRESVVYHDACYLGRYRGIYDEPRQVIGSRAKVVDPPRSRQRGFCCGAGGGLVFLGEEKGKRVNVERARELAATGAGVVAAACPFCNTMLRDGLSSAAPDGGPKLLDIAQIAAAGIEG
jgi:Fe-S oxidoreductase/energy-converting hydrogenase Eha subunit A